MVVSDCGTTKAKRRRLSSCPCSRTAPPRQQMSNSETRSLALKRLEGFVTPGPGCRIFGGRDSQLLCGLPVPARDYSSGDWLCLRFGIVRPNFFGASPAVVGLGPFRYFNSSSEVIRLVVMMYVRFPLSLRTVEGLLAERGIDVSHETVRFWWNRFGPTFAGEIRKRRAAHMHGYPRWRCIWMRHS
jgi:hypothetical protein